MFHSSKLDEKMETNTTPKTVVKRRRKLLSDNIQGITKPALQRLLQRAGIKRISSLVYEELRGEMKFYMEGIIKNMVTFVTYDRRKTAKVEDLEASLHMINIEIAAGINNKAKKSSSIQSCNSRGKSRPTKVKKAKPEEDEQPEGEEVTTRKPHRFRPGTQAVRSIRYQQKNSDCLAIPKANFSRLTREISQDYMEDIRFSEGVIELLQIVVENFIIELCRDAYMCSIHAKRDTLHTRDIILARRLRRE